ncbi:MAG TPA: hypothetical protein VJ343_01980 [archaeon]|nr:hypothetical protein [archaeon]
MPTVSIFTFDKLSNVYDICKLLDGKKFIEAWINAKPSKYNKDEAFIQFWHYEDVEENLNKFFSEEDAYEIVSFLKENGKSKVLRRTYCFINTRAKTFEIYRGPDQKTYEIISIFENLLGAKFASLKLKSDDLQRIYSNHSLELKQVMFKNVEGLIYDILRGNFLEQNKKFKECLEKFPDCLRVISFRPKIKFLNNYNKYQVTINGDKGTIRLSEGMFSWRPRYEIRQIVFIVAATIGLIAS